MSWKAFGATAGTYMACRLSQNPHRHHCRVRRHHRASSSGPSATIVAVIDCRCRNCLQLRELPLQTSGSSTICLSTPFALVAMPVVSEMVHPRSLDFENQRKVVQMRDEGYSWDDIAAEVVNLEGEPSTPNTCRTTYLAFSKKKNRRPFQYANCGRTAWKITPEVEKFIVRKLKELRKTCVCTSTTLQTVVARELKVKVSAGHIRKVLANNGYKWLRRTMKRIYSKGDKEARRAFARKVSRMSAAELRETMSLAMDGVVIIIPPEDDIERINHCRYGEEYMYRLPSEGNHPDLQGNDDYYNQAPLSRVVPLWGGVSAGGFGIVAFHKKRKLNDTEWSGYVRSGKLSRAIQSTNPVKKNGPWTVLCDNEGFLNGKKSKAAHKKSKVALWKVPPRSPDLNPVEKYWSWLRKKLRALDLEDAVKRRPVLTKTMYIQRIRSVVASKKSQTVAKNYALGLKKVCKEVLSQRVNGGATRG